jgi:hypothetical protein
LGDLIAGGHQWLRAARRIGIALVAAVIAFGAYFISSRSLDLLANHDAIIGATAGFAVLVLLGFVEWRRWLRNFLRAPTTIFSYSTLFLLTVATFAALGILLWIGPSGIVGFEFARTAEVANRWIAQPNDIARLRTQLVVDFVFIVAYAAMLASYCVAGAKLCWQRYHNLAYRLQEKRKAELIQSAKVKNGATNQTVRPTSSMRFFYGLALVGFAIAGLQWVAAAADATENLGLLWYLNEYSKTKPDVSGLGIAYWAAALKFALIALAGAYAALAFIIGAWKKSGEHPTPLKRTEIGLRVLFVAVSLVYFGFSAYALFVCRPHPENCLPPNQIDTTLCRN